MKELTIKDMGGGSEEVWWERMCYQVFNIGRKTNNDSYRFLHIQGQYYWSANVIGHTHPKYEYV